MQQKYLSELLYRQIDIRACNQVHIRIHLLNNLINGSDEEQYISKLSQQFIRDWIVIETMMDTPCPPFHCCDSEDSYPCGLLG